MPPIFLPISHELCRVVPPLFPFPSLLCKCEPVRVVSPHTLTPFSTSVHSPIPSPSHHPSQHPHTLIPLSTSVHHRCILLFIALYKLWGRAPAWKLRAISMQCQCHVMMTWGACRHAGVSASLQLPPHFLHTLCTPPLKGLTPLPLLVFQITHLLPAQTRSKVPAVVHTCVKKYEGWRWHCSGSDDAPVSPKPIRFGALWLKL